MVDNEILVFSHISMIDVVCYVKLGLNAQGYSLVLKECYEF